MDGLSAAASGFAVVSLVVQLVGSVRQIRQFLRNISEAPKELRRLMDLLEELEFILEQVGILVQRQRGNSTLWETGVLTSVLKATNSCQIKLAMLEGVVEATKQAFAASNRTTRTLGSFKLACKKKDLREIESQLHNAANLLSLSMMANLTYVENSNFTRRFC
jgi:hypothetical protein